MEKSDYPKFSFFFGFSPIYRFFRAKWTSDLKSRGKNTSIKKKTFLYVVKIQYYQIACANNLPLITATLLHAKYI